MAIAVIFSFLIPFVYVVIGLIALLNPPKKINGFAGYRTASAMQNQETWDFANKFSGKLIFLLGIVLTLLTIIADIIGLISGGDTFAVFLIILVCIQTAAVAYVIIKTEQALKNKFH